MTTTSPHPIRPYRRSAPRAKSASLPVFRAPPLRSTLRVDVAQDLDAIRRHREELAARLGTVLRRGHARD